MLTNKQNSADKQRSQLERTMQVVADIEQSKTKSGYPPVENWHPDVVGEIDIRIDREGNWYYQEEVMARQAMVKLFSSILRLDDDNCYYLVTPVEKMKITVDVAPFAIIDFRVDEQNDKPTLVFIDSVGDEITLNNQEQFQIHTTDNDEPQPFLMVRRNLKGLINRNVFYRLVNIAEERRVNGVEQVGVWSSGLFFELG